jgi:hypothetical protein
MGNVKLSDLEGSVTEVAVIVGDASAPDGTVAGGVYVAASVGEPGTTSSVPHREQLAPPAVRVQFTPALAESLDTVAVSVIGPPPAGWSLNLFVMMTLIGMSAGAIENVKLSDAEGLVTEVAVIVGDAFASVGPSAGGIYVAVNVGEAPGVSFPHLGEQFVPPAVRAQVTPALAKSLDTVAVSVTGPSPAFCVENLDAMLTVIAGVIEKSMA